MTTDKQSGQATYVRGPLRPGKLRSVRSRQARRLASHAFRGVDVVFIAIVTGVMLAIASPGPVLQAPTAFVAPFVLGGLLLVHVLSASGAYRFDRGEPWWHHVAHVGALSFIVGVITTAIAALLDESDIVAQMKWWPLVLLVGICLLHTFWWLLVARWRKQHWLTPNIVLVGATARAEELINEAIARDDINVIGIFDDRLERSPLAVLGVPVLGNTEALLTHRTLPHVDLIVVTVDPSATVRVREIMTRLSTLPNEVTLMVDQDEDAARLAAVAHLADAPLAPVARTADHERKAVAKRVQDLAIALPMLLIAAPVIALSALAVKLDSRGPILFRQVRHGFNNEEILICKFRTMRHEAADAKAERQVTAGDDRVTRVGRVLRKTSLDELPQLFNVFRGEMSLVGPRPHAIGMKTGEIESAQLVADYAHRHRIKPGLTGWAAVNGSRGPMHSPAEVKRRVALDVEYIERQSLGLDLKIMLMTLPALLGDRSAVR
ncbi:exopolysaccharide biosynthesis polyprenyl glycosylphosphotransferase [Antrihabitans stalactiti]|uniref:exopolysaccharide biosynthesis polyprenyl glycosylphosphotransferase n=1 Tax=Antrihabitans stalactiti TaxID=2584121 RepID=UPI0030B800CA